MTIDQQDLPSSLILYGGGNMGRAMLEGWLNVGLRGSTAIVIDPRPSSDLLHLCAGEGIAVNPPRHTISPPQALVLAVKPQILNAIGRDVAPLVDTRTTLVSVLAGTTLGALDAAIPGCGAIVRSMPNLPAALGRSATGAIGNAGVDPRRRSMVEVLLRAIGIVAWVEDESLIDACTAVSGSGPAYVFLLAEELAKAGVAAGLPEELATRLARATVSGAGALLERSDLPASALRESVTSPGGTTAAALDVLMAEDALSPLMLRAVAAAKKRAAELSE